MGEEQKEDSSKSNKNTIPDWKSALSGTLNDTQLTFALIVLFVYFVVYIFAHADGVFIDNNRKDVDVIKDVLSGDCNCKTSHKNFYIAWFTICSTVWVLGPFVLWIFQWCNCCSSALNCTNMFAKFHSSITAIAKWIKSFNSVKIKEIANTILTVLKLFKIDKTTGPLKKIEDLKWLEYYNLQISGTHIKQIKFKKFQKRILEVIGPVNELNKPDQTIKKNPDEKSKTIDGEVDIEGMEGNYCCGCCCCIFYLVCMLLEGIRIIAQRATVPLLMIQAFDTYAFLCFTGNRFCTVTAQYDIPLGQAAFTFAFSISIMASTLTIAMLKWFKYERKKFLCCCRTQVKCSQYKWIQSCI